MHAFDVLGDPVRRRIMELLADGERASGEIVRVIADEFGLTQPAVEPGQSFDYDFTAPDAGTYWYHSHYLSYEQVARGLFGP